jgi:hypothetical protein
LYRSAGVGHPVAVMLDLVRPVLPVRDLVGDGRHARASKLEREFQTAVAGLLGDWFQTGIGKIENVRLAAERAIVLHLCASYPRQIVLRIYRAGTDLSAGCLANQHEHSLGWFLTHGSNDHSAHGRL